MEVIKDITNLKFEDNTGVALGNFDGVHLGHVELIKHLKENSIKYGYESLVFTFDEHTLKTLAPSKSPSLLTSSDKKRELIKRLDVDYLIMVKFDKRFSLMDYKEFIENILVKKLNVAFVVVGSDFRFGHNGEGNVEILKKYAGKYNYRVDVVHPVLIDDVKVSSSYIRSLIKDGKVDIVPKYLGRYYSLNGKVIKGNNYGTKVVGYPTANITIDNELCLPPNGVYITQTLIDGHYHHSLTNVGYSPTFYNKSFSIETHIFDINNENLYGKNIEVEFLKYIRGEIKFSNVAFLQEKIKDDISYALNYFKALDT